MILCRDRDVFCCCHGQAALRPSLPAVLKLVGGAVALGLYWTRQLVLLGC